MSESSDAHAFRSLLGDESVVEHSPIEVEGLKLGLTLRPERGDAAVETLKKLARDRCPVLVRGAGTNLCFGNPPRDARALLSTERWRGVEVMDASDGVAYVAAGTPIAELREQAAAAGWEPTLEASATASTLGGILSSARLGARALAYGSPREAVLGLETLLATGERSHCGGRVVKNVTGYDMAKLYVGSLGSLAVIEAAWLRLRPLPEQLRVLCAPIREVGTAVEQGLSIARRSSARCVALLDARLGARLHAGLDAGLDARPDAGTDPVPAAQLVVELAGAASTVSADHEAIRADLDATDCDRRLTDRVAELQAGLPEGDGLRFRIASLPSRVGEVLRALGAEGAELLAHPGTGLVYAGFPLDATADELTVDRVYQAVRAITRRTGGSFLLESAPFWAKRGRESFGEPGDALPLCQALKQRFDPDGILNPGRAVGGL